MSVVPTIAVIGVGQLGSRYLQGLVPVQEGLTIFAVDPNPKGLDIAKRRWEEVGGNSSPHVLQLCQSVSSFKDDLDLVIVSTPSVTRLDAVQNLREQRRVKSWILEKLLTNRLDELQVFEGIFEGEDSVWVNLPYRVSPWHNEIRREIIHSGPSRFVISGEDYGLITNAIHYLDLVAWWMDATIQVVDFEPDVGGFFLSKRPGFVESNGKFHARYQDGSEAIMLCKESSKEGSSPGGLIIEADGSTGKWEMNESSGSVRFADGQIVRGSMQLQSELTARLVSSIIGGQGCALPTLAETIPLHEKILVAAQLEWDRHPINDYGFVPIT